MSFLNIKDVSRDDVLAAHRMPPVLLGIVPKGSGSFGDIARAADVYYYTEVAPLMENLKQINDWAGEEIIRFRDYQPLATATQTPAP